MPPTPNPTSPATATPAFVHVDLDGLWTLAGCYGFAEGAGFTDDPVFEFGLPRLLDLFEEFELQATFFIVGRDLEHPAKRELIADIARRGHALANHSWSHHFGLEQATEEERQREIERTSTALAELTGRRPLGFRAPGYTAGPQVLTALSRAGLRYDGSPLPTRWGPLLRLLAGRLRAQVRREAFQPGPEPPQIEGQYGGTGLNRPGWFKPRQPELPPVQIFPLAVSPRLTLPLHASLGILLGERYVLGALRALARRGQPVTYLLHGLDAVAPQELAGRLPRALLRTRPFQIPLARRIAFLRAVLGGLKALCDVRCTEAWLEESGLGSRGAGRG